MQLRFDDQIQFIQINSSNSSFFISNSLQQTIRGEYDEEDQKQDDDLGTTLTPGFRNIGGGNRVFGTPSIKTDMRSNFMRFVHSSFSSFSKIKSTQSIDPSKMSHLMAIQPQLVIFFVLLSLLTKQQTKMPGICSDQEKFSFFFNRFQFCD